MIIGANPSFIKSLKIQVGEKADYLEEIERAKKEGYGDGTNNMRIIPVSFAKEQKAMLGHCKITLEDGYIGINPKFEKLIVALLTAVDNDGTLDKTVTSYHDIFDSFRLALKFYQFQESDSR